jgi:hypothetical protein
VIQALISVYKIDFSFFVNHVFAMDLLPNELIVQIADYCDLSARKSLASANFGLRALIWRNLPLFAAHRQKYIAVVGEINAIEHVIIIIPNLYTIYGSNENNGSASLIEYKHLQFTKKVVYLSIIMIGNSQKYRNLNCVSVCNKTYHVKKMYTNTTFKVEYISDGASQRILPYVKFKCNEITLSELINTLLTTHYVPLLSYAVYKN